MHNILKQYENALRSKRDFVTTGDKLAPIFSGRQVNFKPTSPITHMTAAGNRLVVATANKHVLLIDMAAPNTPTEVDLLHETSGSRLQHVFVDPGGRHVLVATLARSGDLSAAALWHLTAPATAPATATAAMATTLGSGGGGASNVPVRVRAVSQMKGTLVTAVGWQSVSSSLSPTSSSPSSSCTDTTGPILMGSSLGAVYETKLCLDEKLFSKFELYNKKLYELPEQQSVCAVVYYRVPVGRVSAPSAATGTTAPPVSQQWQHCALLATATRLYQFVGEIGAPSSAAPSDRPVLASVFSLTAGVPEQFREIPSSWPVSRLVFFTPDGAKYGLPSHFAWMTEPGVLFGELNFNTGPPSADTDATVQSVSGDPATATATSGGGGGGGGGGGEDSQLIGDTFLISHASSALPSLNTAAAAATSTPAALLANEGGSSSSKSGNDDGGGGGGGGRVAVAGAVAVTQFHVISVMGRRLTAVNTLSQLPVFDDVIPTDVAGSVVAVARDSSSGVVWLATERAVFRYTVTDESRNVWQILVDKGMFSEARRCCQNNPDVIAKILAAHAEKCFNEARYEESAEIYAESDCRLEEVALKFISAALCQPLRLFLKKRLDLLSELSDGQRRLSLVLILLWILELFLNQLDTAAVGSSCFEQLQKQLILFVTEDIPKDILDQCRDTVYDMLKSHGYPALAARLATQLHDYALVVRQQLKQGKIDNALRTLSLHPHAALVSEFVCQLLTSAPSLAADLLISQSAQLSASQLVPQLLMANKSAQQGVEIVRYLEHCVFALKCCDTSVHNLLVTLYVQHFSAEPLMKYLRSQGMDRSRVRYSVAHVLRQCRAARPLAAVFVLSVAGHLEEAVALALQHDLAVAKQVANSRLANEEMRKRLWLLVAEHVIKHGDGAQCALQVISECRLLTIEDVLPFCSDFSSIDEFKDAICQTLQTYNAELAALRGEMDEVAQASDNLAAEAANLWRRCTPVAADARCDICRRLLLTSAVYVFRCRHTFHRQCLMTQVRGRLDQSERELLDQWQTQLASLTHIEKRLSTSGDTYEIYCDKNEAEAAVVRAKIDNMVSSQCLLCGDYLVSDLDNLLTNASLVDTLE